MKISRLRTTETAFLNLRGFNPQQDRAVDRAVVRVAKSGQYVLGPEVENFEHAWAEYVGAENCISVGNGLSALELGLKVLGVKSGDEVLVPEKTFVATWMAVSNIGAIPVPIPSESGGFNLDATRISEYISPKTKAIIPVHLYGHPADIGQIAKYADLFGIQVLEDAAQAHGASLAGKRIGGHDNLVAWSFYPGKNLGALGDGGALTTNSKVVADNLRLLRNYGSRKKYIHETIGQNSRLDEIQAAVLSAKLPYLTEANTHRRRIAEIYLAELEKIGTNPSLNNLRNVRRQEESGLALSSWHLFSFEVTRRREDFVAELRENGIETSCHYPIWPRDQVPYSLANGNTNKNSNSVPISLPIGPHLSLKQARKVARVTARVAESLEIFRKTS